MSETETSHPRWAAYLCEFWGTFCLVLIGTGAIVIDDLTQQVTPVGVALCFGLVVFVVIYSIGSISGAHINPAVSIGFFATREIGIAKLGGYIACQIGGALCASLLLRGLFPAHPFLGATLPNHAVLEINTVMVCVVLEFILTFILMWVILAMTMHHHPTPQWTGLVVGGVIAMEALAAGPICGASMNPARSLGPAIVSLNLQYLWIYILAPIAGALAASLLAPVFFGPRLQPTHPSDD